MLDCDYAYLNQPPSEIPCNLYDNDSSVIVHCDAVSLTSPNYTINWYHEGERDTNLTTGFIQHIFAQPGLQAMYFYFSRLLLTAEDEPGQYYCKIEATDNDTVTEFEPGNAIYLRESEFYQNESSCNITELTVSNDTCAHTYENFTITPTVGSNGTTQEANFPPWGYAIPTLVAASILVTAIAIFCACIKICQRSRENFKESYKDYELASVQESSSIGSSTDHTYEELDLPEVDIEQSLHTHINGMAVEHDMSIPSSNHTPTCTPPAEIKNIKSDQSEVHNKLLDVISRSLHDTIVMKNEDCATYDKLDPKVEVNLSYSNRHNSCDPVIVINPSYSKTEAFVVMKNKAYNKRDEFDPKTGVCPAYSP